jgi:large subunit ribosomal protein L24
MSAAKLKLKKGDTVVVIAGDAIGKQGKIVEVDRAGNRAVVEGVNLVKKHTKPTTKFPQGGIQEVAASIHMSNLMLMDAGKATRVGRKVEEGKVVRIAKKTQTILK